MGIRKNTKSIHFSDNATIRSGDREQASCIAAATEPACSVTVVVPVGLAVVTVAIALVVEVALAVVVVLVAIRASAGLGRVVSRSIAHRWMSYVVRHAHRDDDARAACAGRIGCREGDVVDAAIAVPAPFGADRRLARPHAEPID
jgi:hypothetical protein